MQRQFKKYLKKKLSIKNKKQINLSNKFKSERKDEQVKWDVYKDYVTSNSFNALVLNNSINYIEVLYKNRIYKSVLYKGIDRSLLKTIVVGDYLKIIKDLGSYFIIYRIPRKNYISKIKTDATRLSAYQYYEQIIAANIDLAVIVASAGNPPFNSRIIDRYLIICQYNEVKPLICLNKCDLTFTKNKMIKWYKDKLDINSIKTSTISGEGIQELKNIFSNKMVILLGQSGVGKSSLINSLNPNFKIKVKSISKKNKKGKHTTTKSSIYVLNRNVYIIDTPGIRSLGIENINKNEIKNYFTEFNEYNNLCKYNDCIHYKEDCCAVRNAVMKGLIVRFRYESYIKLLED